MAAGFTLKLSTDFHGDRAFLPTPNRDRHRFIRISVFCHHPLQLRSSAPKTVEIRSFAKIISFVKMLYAMSLNTQEEIN
ncbi:hypothetical protein SD81_004135 [Tolypothrix campylonemoides VB511288]|nr:hypothetical protein SD81_004135 [Tolypothrix campylonemoides VB511288]